MVRFHVGFYFSLYAGVWSFHRGSGIFFRGAFPFLSFSVFRFIRDRPVQVLLSTFREGSSAGGVGRALLLRLGGRLYWVVGRVCVGGLCLSVLATLFVMNTHTRGPSGIPPLSV